MSTSLVGRTTPMPRCTACSCPPEGILEPVEPGSSFAGVQRLGEVERREDHARVIEVDHNAPIRHVLFQSRSQGCFERTRGLRVNRASAHVHVLGHRTAGVAELVCLAQIPGHAVWLTDLLGIEAAESRIAQGNPDLAVRIVGSLEQSDPGSAIRVLGRAHLARGDWTGLGDAVAELVDGGNGIPLPAVVGERVLEAALELHGGQQRRARAALGRSLQMAAPSLRRSFREAPWPSVGCWRRTLS